MSLIVTMLLGFHDAEIITFCWGKLRDRSTKYTFYFWYVKLDLQRKFVKLTTADAEVRVGHFCSLH